MTGLLRKGLLQTGIVCAANLAGSAACTIGPLTGDDAGTDASAPAVSTATVGEQCQEVSTELCLKASSCGIAVASLSDCVSNYMLTCCVGSACTMASTSSALVVSNCKSAIDAEDCNSYVNNELPTSCTALLHTS